MDKKIILWQICYKPEHRLFLYDFAQPYFNESIGLFFENSIIETLVKNSQDTEYIGVCSWKLKQKRTEGSCPIILNNQLDLSEEKILSKDFDVALLMPFRDTHNVMAMAENWHGKAWVDSFNHFKSNFLYPIKMKPVANYAIYSNHFIARTNLYKEYVERLLSPAIIFMKNHEDIYSTNANYAPKKSLMEREDYKNKTGRNDWPIAPFILERLFSIYLSNLKYKLNIINL